MHIKFIERILENGNYEITIKEGKETLKKAIEGKYIFPEKLILTKEQKEENKVGLKDILTGAFCMQEFPNMSFEVENEKGEKISDYSKSLFDGVGGEAHA